MFNRGFNSAVPPLPLHLCPRNSERKVRNLRKNRPYFSITYAKSKQIETRLTQVFSISFAHNFTFARRTLTPNLFPNYNLPTLLDNYRGCGYTRHLAPHSPRVSSHSTLPTRHSPLPPRVKLPASMSPSPTSKSLASVGCLYLVSTPIGNLEDITLRALRILREADVIACEDTRQTQKLLQHFEIRKRLVSYHEHNEITRGAELAIEMEQGAKVALVSDAGTPVLSDPGHQLVILCLRHHIPVIPIPGPSAALAALSASGLPIEEFLFVGFLPARAGARRKALTKLRARTEGGGSLRSAASHRGDAARRARNSGGSSRGRREGNYETARGISARHSRRTGGGRHEAKSSRRNYGRPRGPLRPSKNAVESGEESRGISRPAENAPRAPRVTLSQRIAQLMVDEGLDHKAALKKAGRERGLAKREAYRQLLLER